MKSQNDRVPGQETALTGERQQGGTIRLNPEPREEIVPVHKGEMSAGQQNAAFMETMQQFAQSMQAVMQAQNETNKAIIALVRRVELLEKITSAQAAEINRAVREQAKAIVIQNPGMAGCEVRIANAIRKEIRLVAGVGSIRDLSRHQFKLYLEQAREWDDYRALQDIKRRVLEA